MFSIFRNMALFSSGQTNKKVSRFGQQNMLSTNKKYSRAAKYTFGQQKMISTNKILKKTAPTTKYALGQQNILSANKKYSPATKYAFHQWKILSGNKLCSLQSPAPDKNLSIFTPAWLHHKMLSIPVGKIISAIPQFSSVNFARWDIDLYQKQTRSKQRQWIYLNCN